MAEIIEQSRIPKRTLVDGSKVPAIGLGTFGSDKYNSDQIAEAVYGGIRAGYRMIDCASVYQNENRACPERRNRGSSGFVYHL